MEQDKRELLRQRLLKVLDSRRREVEGGAFWDTLKDVAAKAKDGYDFYQKHKDTIHGVADAVAPHLKQAVGMGKKRKPTAHALMTRELMKKHGLSLAEASRMAKAMRSA